MTGKIVLVGNHAGDGQQSMLRFIACLQEEYARRGVAVETLSPKAGFSRLVPRSNRLWKWLAHLDKYVIFPRALRRRVNRSDLETVFHICDHSNAMYLRQIGRCPHLVTCHDLLAVRGALGDKDAFCEIGRTGKVLQYWIRASLGRARAVTCDSRATQTDFERLYPGFTGKLVHLPMGLNSPYHSVEPQEAWGRLSRFSLRPDLPFILVVGSNHFRKNRDGALRIFQQLGSRFTGTLAFAGQKLSDDQRELARTLGVATRVIELGAVTNPELEALYSVAHVLLFPSRSEGFGWPVLEAQACGCPVMCSNRTSIPEVAGEGAFVHDLADEAGAADSIVRLLDPAVRSELRQKGFRNAATMTTTRMVDDYLALYRSILSSG